MLSESIPAKKLVYIGALISQLITKKYAMQNNKWKEPYYQMRLKERSKSEAFN